MATRKLKVVKLNEIKRGEGKYGTWVMSEVTADDENGNRIDKNLVTFKGDKLPLNELVEVEVEKKEKDGYPPSYTIKPFDPNRPPSREEFKLLVERVSDLEDKVELLDRGSKTAENASQSLSEGIEIKEPPLDEVPF